MSNKIEVDSTPVCVTGGTGFVAAHIIVQLLKEGYSINTTVRSLKDESKFKFLKDLDKDGKIHFFEADLNKDGSFDDAVKGCKAVFHVASPYALKVDNPQKDLVDPAVQGTLTVLQSCLKNGVKKVVLTSSVAAITDSPVNDHVYTEADWNNESSLARNPYYYSKKLAEEAAWKYHKEHPDLDLVVVNPFIIIGPELNPKALNPSNKIFSDIMDGTFPAILSLGWGFVDVRDVAKAHILAMKDSKAEGRYLVCNKALSMEEVVDKLKDKYPTYKFPTKKLNCGIGDSLIKLGSYFQDSGTGSYLRTNIGRILKFDNSKVVKLGLDFIPVDQSIFDSVDDLIKKGVVKH